MSPSSPKSTVKLTAAEKRAVADRERLRELCKLANKHMTADGTVSAGAPVTIPQMKAVEAFLKRSARNGVYRYLACTRNQLRSYVRHQTTITSLPEKARDRLAKGAPLAKSYSKPWPLKSASILFAIAESRAASSKKRSKPSANDAAAPESNDA